VSYQASHDALTGLINRREFEHRCGLALASARELGRHHAMMYLDLDQFKLVNDTSGHAAGDELMRQISMVLQERLREGDTLARLGGDEFGVLLENCQAEHAARIADELRQTVTDFHFEVRHARAFTIGQHRAGQYSDGAMTLADVSRRRRGVLRGQGEGTQPRTGLSAKDSEVAVRTAKWSGWRASRRARRESVLSVFAGHHRGG
jgi:diguanylate cyclase (GGDEF)-like protein